jgi:predicted XRE-type DNA-binding protein
MKAKEQWKSRRLSDDDIRGILYALREGGLSQRQISEIYQVTQAYISRLGNGKASRTVNYMNEKRD